MNNKTVDYKKIASVAMLSAFAFLARLVFKIPVSFLTFDIKDSVIALGGLVFGPVSGVVIALLVSLIEMIIKMRLAKSVLYCKDKAVPDIVLVGIQLWLLFKRLQTVLICQKRFLKCLKWRSNNFVY